MISEPTISIKRALVTGGTGIVGTPLVSTLTGSGVDVTVLVRSAQAADSPTTDVRYLIGDISENAFIETLENEKFDVVFNVAAAVHGSAKDRAVFFKINVNGVENVVDYCQRTSTRLVHVSTVNVDSYRRGVLKDHYSESKSLAEEVIDTAVQNGLDAVIVRPATVFGSEPGRAGLLVERVLNGSLKVLPAPRRVISPVWAGDLANALVSAATHGGQGQTYTVAGPATDTRSFIRTVANLTGNRVPLVGVPATLVALPLFLLGILSPITRWTPPVTAKGVLADSIHDGRQAADELGFSYSDLSEIFSR